MISSPFPLGLQACKASFGYTMRLAIRLCIILTFHALSTLFKIQDAVFSVEMTQPMVQRPHFSPKGRGRGTVCTVSR